MGSPAQPSRLIRFGAFELDAANGELRKAGVTLKIHPQPLQVLQLLAEHSGEIVTREKIQRCLWHDNTFVDFERGINFCVNQIRDTLGDDAEKPQYIETLPRRGYRFIAHVNVGAVPTVPGASRSRLATAGVALVMVLLVAGTVLGVYSLSRRRTPPFRNMSITKLTESGTAYSAAISPDGKYVLHVALEKGLQSLWLRHIPTGSNTQVVPPIAEDYSGLTFSRDGNYIYFVRSDKKHPATRHLYQAPVLGGTPRLVISNVNSAISFSPDGTRFVFLRYDSEKRERRLIIANADGSGEGVLPMRKTPDFFESPDWSPDGNPVAFVAFTESGETLLQTVDISSGAVKTITSPQPTNSDLRGFRALRWMPDGKGLVILQVKKVATGRSNQVSFVAYPSGEISRITNDLATYEALAGVTADGKIVATVQSERSFGLWVMPAAENATRQARQIGLARDEGSQVAWTGDGRVLTSSVDRGVFARSADGKNMTNIFAGTAMSSPTICGDYLVMNTWTSDPGVNILRVDLSGGATRQLTFGRTYRPSCSSDGQWVTYMSENDGKLEVFKVSIQGGAPRKISDLPGVCPTFSPDGKLIAFFYMQGSRSEDSQERIVAIPAAGGAPLYTFAVDPRSVNSPRIQFTPDGKGLAYVLYDGGTDNLWVQPLPGGPLTQLTFFTSERIDDFAFSPDGKSIAFLRGHRTKDVVLIKDENR